MKKLILASIILITLSSCELYPDWQKYVEYSSVFPVCGEYYVRDYDPVNDTVPKSSFYLFYIYNKAYNPTGDSVYLDNFTGHPATGQNVYEYRFKIKAKADLKNLTFNVEKAPLIINPNPNPILDTIKVTISNSKIYRLAKDITDPTPDSIYFKFTIYSNNGAVIAERIVKGHRKTGWEQPNYDDYMENE